MEVTKKQASGWGQSIKSSALDFAPQSLEQLQDFLGTYNNIRGVIAHGLRRSYGDSSLNVGGLTVGTEGFNQIRMLEHDNLVTVGSGVSIRTLEKFARAGKFFPPIVPGTGFVTIGGAIAADIHGKSHHRTGAFSSCVRRIRLLYSDGEICNIYPIGPSADHFWATIGGLGLTGIIIEADLQLIPMDLPFVEVREERVDNLEAMIDLLARSDTKFEHTVAWIDLSGDFRGRGLVSLANYVQEGKEIKKSTAKIDSKPLSLPRIGDRSLINRGTVRAFNELWFRKPLTTGISPIETYMHPLDRLQNWNRAYGKNGLLQYQFVVPDANEDFLEDVLLKMKAIGAASFLGVLKRFGEQSLGHLSFPKPGWTLALDFPASLKNLERTLNSIDSELVSRGGRIYLVKDSRLNPEFIPIMYPRLEEWRSTRNNMDTRGMWQSDQSRRLRLC